MDSSVVTSHSQILSRSHGIWEGPGDEATWTELTESVAMAKELTYRIALCHLDVSINQVW